eukprot:CAMPEP_0184753460 /NCGR_PEP_ID=MMETSP0315-20130426/44111_1 /TAXON_ID=101924 /ORGANISM="Rhodosorus marinus, Strain UTEX LB 2760" /LENGTH=375 /DNA_ID=CAMNT_0027232837 /DNA_START=438 /DNA_END=1565 /DNA_ORIENTATION=+
MDPRLKKVAKELMSELGREGAIQLLITEDDGWVKEEIEKVCLGLSTGPQFRGHVLLALRKELFEDQVVLRSALELYRDREVLKTGIRSLDLLLGGDGIGIGADGQLIEFTGRAGAGKSQLCMQLALMSGAPREFGGLENGCVYINTEGSFPVSRMLEIETGLREKLELRMDYQGGREFSRVEDAGDETGLREKLELRMDYQGSSLSDKVIVERCRSADSLISLCSYRLPWLLEQSRARVVIVDSVAAPLRFNSDRSARSGSVRDSLLFQLVKALRTVARKFKALVLLTNQVTDVFIEAYQERAGGDEVARVASTFRTSAWDLLEQLHVRQIFAKGGPTSTKFIEVLSSPSKPTGKKLALVVGQAGVSEPGSELPA